MTNNEIIEGLKFTMDMCLFNPVDGSKRPISMLNDMDKITYNACEGAIKALEQQPIILRKEHTNEVLEKIKAELIKYLSDYDFGTGYQNDVAMIIDKYIEGSESE